MERRELALYIDRTYKVVSQDLIHRFRDKQLDITPEQWVVLSRLKFEGALYQSDLASKGLKINQRYLAF